MATTTPKSLTGLLESLTQSVTSAFDVTPKVAALPHPDDGISLLDVKNELLLTYLQHLVFLIIVKLRAARGGRKGDAAPLADSVVRRLVELRLFLEKGTRPLEEKMRYQIDMLIRAANDAERKLNGDGATKDRVRVPDGARSESDGSEGEGSENSEDHEDDDDDGTDLSSDEADEATARPRLSNLIAPSRGRAPAPSDNDEPEPGDGIYRPPRRQRQLMEDPAARRRGRDERRPQKSATIDEFVADEMSAAPLAEPSVGTNVEGRGRRVKTAAERAAEAERRDYEESNFVRLPGQTKKERAKLRAAAQGRGRMAFGGEDFHDIGGQVERIDRLTRRKDSGGGNNVKALLERSRKRGRDSMGGGGVQIGESFHKKAKLMETGRGGVRRRK